ncbi:MAG TPA: polyprenol monophosphomannose synthase [Terracidiphilus sp.]
MRKKSDDKLVILIPTRDEAANIPSLLTRIRSALDPAEILYEILVVDDDSRDGTAELVSAAARADDRIRLLIRRGERGLSGAILHGWRHSDAEILGVMDADLQHPPELLPALLTAILEGRDLAIASRYVPGGMLRGWNPIRRLFSAAAICAAQPLQCKGMRVQDPLSGFFLVRRRCLDGVFFQKAGFKLLLEILVRSHIRSVQEIPFTFGPRHAGRSKAGVRIAFDYIALLARLYRERFARANTTPTLTMDH